MSTSLVIRKNRKPVSVRNYNKLVVRCQELESKIVQERRAFTELTERMALRFKDGQGMVKAMAHLLQVTRMTDAFSEIEKEKVLQVVREFRPDYDFPKTQYELENPAPADADAKLKALDLTFCSHLNALLDATPERD